MAGSKRIPIGPTSLRRWLETQPEGAVVGNRSQALSCPIAAYIRAQGGTDPMVDGSAISYTIFDNLPDERRVLHKDSNGRAPRWARTFMHRIDRPRARERPRIGVTREEALAALPKKRR